MSKKKKKITENSKMSYRFENEQDINGHVSSFLIAAHLVPDRKYFYKKIFLIVKKEKKFFFNYLHLFITYSTSKLLTIIELSTGTS